MRLHHRAPAAAELGAAGDPPLDLPGSHDVLGLVAQDPAIAHQQAAICVRDDVATWRHAILQWHVRSPLPASPRVLCSRDHSVYQVLSASRQGPAWERPIQNWASGQRPAWGSLAAVALYPSVSINAAIIDE